MEVVVDQLTELQSSLDWNLHEKRYKSAVQAKSSSACCSCM